MERTMVGVGVGVGVAVGVGVVGVGVCVAVGVEVGVGVRDGVGDGVGVREGVGVARGKVPNLVTASLTPSVTSTVSWNPALLVGGLYITRCPEAPWRKPPVFANQRNSSGSPSGSLADISAAIACPITAGEYSSVMSPTMGGRLTDGLPSGGRSTDELPPPTSITPMDTRMVTTAAAMAASPPTNATTALAPRNHVGIVALRRL